MQSSANRRFLLQSIALATLVLLWVIALRAVNNSHRWRVLFAASPVVTQADGATGAIAAEEDRWLVHPPASGEVRSVVRLPRVDLLSATDYLLTLRVGDGPDLQIGWFPAPTDRPVDLKRVPARDGSVTYRILLQAEDLKSPGELRIFNRSSQAIEVTELSLRPLAAAQRWIGSAVGAVGPVLILLFGLHHRRRLKRYCRTAASPAVATDLLVAWLLLLLLFVAYRQAPNSQLMDSRYLTVVSHSLLRSGSLALREDFGPLVRRPELGQFEHLDGRAFHFFANAPAVLNAPIVLLFERSGISSVAADGRYLRHQELRILRFAAALTAALIGATLFLLARLWLPPGSALLLTLAFAFGSQIFSTISRAYWSHAWASLLLAAALYPILSPLTRNRTGAYVLSSTLLSWAFLCRPPMAIAAVAVTLWIFAVRRRFVWPLVATGLGWLGLFIAFTRVERGQWLPSYFFASHLSSGRLLSEATRSHYLEAALGTLVSPGRGLLIFVPMTLAILFVAWRYRHRLPEPALALTAAVVLAAHWQLISSFRNWWGGFGFGPRLFADIVVWLFLLAALGAAAVRRAGPGRSRALMILQGSLIVALVAASIFVHTRGATAKETMLWGAKLEEQRRPRGAAWRRAVSAKLWDWRQPQFLAGIYPPK